MEVSDLPLHHALLVTSNERDAVGVTLWEQMQTPSTPNRFFNQTVLDVDTVRSIISWAHTPYDGTKTAIISFHTAGHVAQNALLKVLEEPPEGVRFILLTSNKEHLLETVLSRLHHVQDVNKNSVDGKNHNIYTADAQLFLMTKHHERMTLSCITTMLAKKDEQDRKDREGVRAFILSLIIVLSEEKVASRYIEECLQIVSYTSDSSASGKALVQYLALLLPQVKV